MCWVGAVMSACGFTWCYLSFLALTAHHFGWLSDEQAQAALSLGYILLLPFLLFAGYAPPTYIQAAPETTTPVINTTCFWGPAPGTEILVNERSTDSMARDMLPLPPPTFGVGMVRHVRPSQRMARVWSPAALRISPTAQTLSVAAAVTLYRLLLAPGTPGRATRCQFRPSQCPAKAWAA